MLWDIDEGKGQNPSQDQQSDFVFGVLGQFHIRHPVHEFDGLLVLAWIFFMHLIAVSAFV